MFKMPTSAELNDLAYPSNVIRESTTGYNVIIFGGVTQTGKSRRGDALVARKENDFVYGPKGKIRPEGTIKEGDNIRPDSILLTPEDYRKLKKQGHVLEGAEYAHGPTKYVPLRSYPKKDWSAVPDGHHVIYVSLNHEGAMRTKEALVNYGPLTFLLYTRLETLRKRLDASKMSEAEITRRLQAYASDFAQFRAKTDDYLFLFHVKSPTIPDDLYCDESAKHRAQTEIQRDMERIVGLISRSKALFKPDISYSDVHQAFVEKQIMALFNTNLDNLGRMLNSRADVRLDVGEQTKTHLESGNFLSEAELRYLSEVRPLGLITANGRYTLLLRGFEEPGFHSANGHRPLEEILLDFITIKSGEQPTIREPIKGQSPNTKSHLGLVKVVRDASLRNGLTYSLGNTHLVDNTHPSLSVVFVYPQREGIDLRTAVIGMDSLDVRNLEEMTIR